MIENNRMPMHDYLLCIDSDGCVFDTMGLKHKECFCPAYIEHFDLQPVAGYARDAWEFANLYSQMRGMHRMLTLLRAMDLLSRRKETMQRGFVPPSLDSLQALVSRGSPPSNDDLRSLAGRDAQMARILAWSLDVNERIARMVHGVPPFPGVRACIAQSAAHADIVVVSATPTEALEREWREQGLSAHVRAIYGQEHGTKRDILASLSKRYDRRKMVMVGDAPGDLAAARANDIAFFPIAPGGEVESFSHFPAMLQALLAGNYDARGYIAAFERILPKDPPWEMM